MMNSLLHKLKKTKLGSCFYTVAKMVFDEAYYERVKGIKEDPVEFKIYSNGLLNPSKVIYKIDLTSDRGLGFFALLRNAMSCLVVADRFGFIPYIVYPEDSLYSEEKPINGSYNAFEYYFQQVSDVTDAEIGASANVLYYETKHLNAVKYGYQEEYENVEAFSHVYKKYIKLNDAIERKVTSEINNLLNGKKTIGIHIRGTDYKQGYKNHPIFITVEEYITILQNAIQEKGFEQIFLATDEDSIVKEISKAFPGKVVFFCDSLRSEDGKAVHTSHNSRLNNKYLMGYEVLRDMLALSKCNALIAGLSNVSLFAMIANRAEGKKYEYCKIINKGVNKTGKIFNEGK